MAAAHPIDNSPNPPRFWWLTRGTAAAVVLVLVLLAIRLEWGRVARARLAAVVAAAHGRGEPTTADDFTDPMPAFDDPRNAAPLLAGAESGVTYSAAQSKWDDLRDPAAPLTPADVAVLDGIVTANAGPLTLARLAVERPDANWGVRVPRPAVGMWGGGSGRDRRLAELLGQAIDFDAATGRDDAAVVTLRAAVRLADAVELQVPSVLTHLVACGVQSTATEAVQRHAAALQLGGPTRAAAVALIGQLLDESAYQSGARRGYEGERLMALDFAADPQAFGTAVAPPPAVLTWPVRPLLTLEAARVFGVDSVVAGAAGQPTWAAADARIAALPPEPAEALRAVEMLLWGTSGRNYRRSVLTHFHGLTDRRAAAVTLALRLYQADHAGRLPADLPALVPGYLPAVPIDPMAADAHPLRYVATPGREAVYSVGDDGHDDGGSTSAGSRLVVGRPVTTWFTNDAVYPFRPPPPATQPAG